MVRICKPFQRHCSAKGRSHTRELPSRGYETATTIEPVVNVRSRVGNVSPTIPGRGVRRARTDTPTGVLEKRHTHADPRFQISQSCAPSHHRNGYATRRLR